MSNQNEVELKQGLIYMIECKDPAIKQFYIGSTMLSYSIRRDLHKSTCTHPNQRGFNSKKYIFIRNNGGWENWNVNVIEYINVKEDYEIRLYEQLWIDTLFPDLNSARAYRSEIEFQQYHEDYRRKHRSKINSKAREKIKCAKCNKLYNYSHKTAHINTKYCKNYNSTASESFIESDTDVE